MKTYRGDILSAYENLNPIQFYHHDPMDATMFYHASDHKFGRGAMVKPGHAPLNSPSPEEHAYFTRTPEEAQDYGKYTYAVNPQGDYEDDPNMIGALRSKSPLRVRYQHS